MIKNNLNSEVAPRSFRHTFQDSLEAAGVEEGTIRHLTGKLPKGSLANYSRSNLSRKKDAIEKLPTIENAIISSVSKKTPFVFVS